MERPEAESVVEPPFLILKSRLAHPLLVEREYPLVVLPTLLTKVCEVEEVFA
jgi:hypothetical protein